MKKNNDLKDMLGADSATVMNKLSAEVAQFPNGKWYGWIQNNRTNELEGTGPKESFGEVMIELIVLGYKSYPRICEEKC